MKKAIIFSLLWILLLFGAGLVAGLHVFAPWEHILADKPGQPAPAAGEMSWNTYKKTRLALGSFDLVNGLTKHDLETMGAERGLGFTTWWPASGWSSGCALVCAGPARVKSDTVPKRRPIATRHY